MPQIEPVTRAIILNTNPEGAKLFAIKKKFLILKIYPITDLWTDNDIFWKDLKELLPHIEEIYFAGGEPLMQEGHYKFLHFLIDNNKSNLEVNYNTNLSVLQYKNENLIDLWSDFERVNIWVSQDGVGKVA